MSGIEGLHVGFDAFELDEAEARLTHNGALIPVPPRAFGVLCVLLRNPGQVISRDDLFDAVWGHRHVSESALKTTMDELRVALSDDDRQPRYVETASRRGYRFLGVTRNLQSAASVAWRKEGARLLDRGGDAGSAASPFASATPLIGRAAALDQLREAWAHACAGERQLVWVTGEAGVGKSSLIDAFVSELAPGVATFGQCIEEFGDGVPYLPILETVKNLCRRDPQMLEAMRSVAPTWLVQMPWLSSAGERAALYDELRGAHHERMVREMREITDRFTAIRPMLLVFEDLQWSDAGTLRMMERFARRPRDVRVMWIASFRLPPAATDDHPLRRMREQLRPYKLCREISLEPFKETEVASYLEERMPAGTFTAEFVRRLHAHTEGLPLFVAKLVDNLQPRQVQDAVLPVPGSLAGLIEKQIERLPPETQGMLEAACVLGMEFRASYLANLLDRDIDWVCDECDQLVRRQYWVRLAGIDELADGGVDPRYALLHSLFKHQFYQRIDASRRVQLHRRALKLLEAARDAGTMIAAAELARHAERGQQFAAAMRYYGEAADNAVAHFAPDVAMDLAAAGLKLLGRVGDGAERAELELGLVYRRGLAAVQLSGAGAIEASKAFNRSLELCDLLPATAAHAAVLAGVGLNRHVCGDYQASLGLAKRVRAIGERHAHEVLRVTAALLSGMTQTVAGEHQAARASFEAGLAACERMVQIPLGAFLIDPLTALHSYLAIPLMALGLCDRARRQVTEAHTRAQAVAQPTAQMLALWADGMVNVRAEEPMKVIECATVLGRVAAKGMLAQGESPARWLRGWALAQAGKALEGHRIIREGYETHARLGVVAGNTEILGYAAEALVLAGDWVYAGRQLDEAMELAERINERAAQAYLLRLRAEVALQEAGELAREALCESLAVARRQKSPLDELKALRALCRHGLATTHERSALRRVCDDFPEGKDLPFMKKAREVLG